MGKGIPFSRRLSADSTLSSLWSVWAFIPKGESGQYIAVSTTGGLIRDSSLGMEALSTGRVQGIVELSLDCQMKSAILDLIALPPTV